ncbi:MAG TPA: hypothetical protein PLK28_19405, partial [Candidatus Rifleibacterium sp.]|nr:hypothetical protein [Candidatus Rifleibacterium sp.]
RGGQVHGFAMNAASTLLAKNRNNTKNVDPAERNGLKKRAPGQKARGKVRGSFERIREVARGRD